jgi:hypothetical protein
MRENDSHAHTHTHTSASTSSKWHSRRSEKERKKERETDRQKKTAHKRETWWLNNEQKIHTNSLIQARRSRETKGRKTGEGKKRKQTNK